MIFTPSYLRTKSLSKAYTVYYKGRRENKKTNKAMLEYSNLQKMQI